MKTEQTQTQSTSPATEEPLVEPMRQLNSDQIRDRNIILAGRTRYLGSTSLSQRTRLQHAIRADIERHTRSIERNSGQESQAS